MFDKTLAFASDVNSKLHSILFPQVKPWEYERGVIGIVYKSTGVKRRSILLRELVIPEPGDVTWKSGEGLIFSTEYKSRAVTQAASKRGAGLIFIHTHNAHEDGSPPEPSDHDLDSDMRDLYFLGQGLSDGAPLAAGIIDENFMCSVREYEFSYPTTASEARNSNIAKFCISMSYIGKIRILDDLLYIYSASGLEGNYPKFSESSTAMTESSILLWGKEGQERLRRLRVGIVGLGGVGSILAEHAARLGIRDFILIDFDRIAKENFNRSQGASRWDVLLKRHKVKIAKKLIKKGAVERDVEIRTIIGSVVEEKTVRDLMDCDLILNASDSPWALQVLDHLSNAHLIPIITGGTIIKGIGEVGTLIAGKCEITLSKPGLLCLECAGSYIRSDVTEAMTPPNVRGERRYLDNANGDLLIRAPSVIATNALVASVMLLRLQALVVGTTPDTVNGIQRYHLLEGGMDYSLVKRCDAICQRNESFATGDACYLPTGVDEDFKVMKC